MRETSLLPRDHLCWRCFSLIGTREESSWHCMYALSKHTSFLPISREFEVSMHAVNSYISKCLYSDSVIFCTSHKTPWLTCTDVTLHLLFIVLVSSSSYTGKLFLLGTHWTSLSTLRQKEHVLFMRTSENKPAVSEVSFYHSVKLELL